MPVTIPGRRLPMPAAVLDAFIKTYGHDLPAFHTQAILRSQCMSDLHLIKICQHLWDIWGHTRAQTPTIMALCLCHGKCLHRAPEQLQSIYVQRTKHWAATETLCLVLPDRCLRHQHSYNVRSPCPGEVHPVWRSWYCVSRPCKALFLRSRFACFSLRTNLACRAK